MKKKLLKFSFHHIAAGDERKSWWQISGEAYLQFTNVYKIHQSLSCGLQVQNLYESGALWLLKL